MTGGPSTVTDGRGWSVHWILEGGVFASGFDLGPAARAAGHAVTRWDDDWWETGRWPRLERRGVVFHGSLGNAAQIGERLPWRPGGLCDTAAFCCSAWYPRAAPWLFQRGWRRCSAAELVAHPPDWPAFFVRPDSPLKAFSGRVLPRAALSLEAMDFGYYFDDPSLPVIVAPARPVEREWRYVVVEGRVVAGSAYAADGRRPLPDAPDGAPWAFAQQIAAQLEPPTPLYVLDLCASEGQLFLLELNPFGGADLYACDPHAVVAAVADWVVSAAPPPR